MINWLQPSRLAERVKALFLLSEIFDSLKRSKKLIAYAHNQKPFEPWQWGLNLNVGHERRSVLVLNDKNTSGSPDQTNKTN